MSDAGRTIFIPGERVRGTRFPWVGSTGRITGHKTQTGFTRVQWDWQSGNKIAQGPQRVPIDALEKIVEQGKDNMTEAALRERRIRLTRDAAKKLNLPNREYARTATVELLSTDLAFLVVRLYKQTSTVDIEYGCVELPKDAAHDNLCEQMIRKMRALEEKEKGEDDTTLEDVFGNTVTLKTDKRRGVSELVWRTPRNPNQQNATDEESRTGRFENTPELRAFLLACLKKCVEE